MMKSTYTYEFLHQHTIYEVVSGSHSYGLQTSSSDVDLKGIVLLPKEELFTLSTEWETETLHEPDIELHSLKKFMNLANSQNPTVLEMLFTEERFIKKTTKYANLLRENRYLFLSQNCFYSFGGYAQQQLMKIKNGLQKATDEDRNKHLKYTVESIIRRFEDRFPAYKEDGIKVMDVRYEHDGKQHMYMDVTLQQAPITQLAGMISEIQNAYKGYTKLTNRNKKPEDKLGKHAMHLIRLLKSGIEVLRDGTFQVYRGEDREFLLSVRNGNYGWDEIFEMIDELEQQLKEAYQNTSLPKKTDWSKIEELYKSMMLDYLKV